MKLSDHQREVLRLMAEGWMLLAGEDKAWLYDDAGHLHPVHGSTIHSLAQAYLLNTHFLPSIVRHFTLTEAGKAIATSSKEAGV